MDLLLYQDEGIRGRGQGRQKGSTDRIETKYEKNQERSRHGLRRGGESIRSGSHRGRRTPLGDDGPRVENESGVGCQVLAPGPIERIGDRS